jgi:peptide-N4-(N-acetyl-beta-glucosaminyl)asparagine amidase
MSSEEVFQKLKSNSSSICEETVRILVKIVDNIVKDPNNLKVRSLQKSNSTVKNKILAIKGGLECLKLLGFQEGDTNFVLPSSTPISKLEEIKRSLLNLKTNDVHQGAIPKLKTDITASNIKSYQENDDDLDNVKRFVLPPLTLKFANPFLQRIERQFHHALAFGDKDCQKRAKKLIPLDQLEMNAQRNLRYLQTRIKKEKLQDPEFSVQDMLLLELLTWFKEEFFSWVNSPACSSCGKSTTAAGMSSDQKDLTFTSRVEVYQCKSCHHVTKFPRYNDLNILLETRRGRCGEWAQVFTLFCRSLGWDARYVVDELDHVWTEVFSLTQNRWIHCDPCENACDTPLMYENGWNKKLTYVIAYSPEEVQEVTWRYSSNHKAVLARRKNCSEDDLIGALIVLRNERQKTMSKSKQSYLTKRLVYELLELMVERKPHDNEKHGRTSGSKSWRMARGEVKSENMYVWRIANKHVVDDKLSIKYSTALDKYEFVKGDGCVITVDEWSFGVFDSTNIFRKEEKDWKTVYICRSEGTDTGSISWKYELENDVTRVIDVVSLKFNHKIYENGVVEIKLISDGICVDFPKSINLLRFRQHEMMFLF